MKSIDAMEDMAVPLSRLIAFWCLKVACATFGSIAAAWSLSALAARNAAATCVATSVVIGLTYALLNRGAAWMVWAVIAASALVSALAFEGLFPNTLMVLLALGGVALCAARVARAAVSVDGPLERLTFVWGAVLAQSIGWLVAFGLAKSLDATPEQVAPFFLAALVLPIGLHAASPSLENVLFWATFVLTAGVESGLQYFVLTPVPSGGLGAPALLAMMMLALFVVIVLMVFSPQDTVTAQS